MFFCALNLFEPSIINFDCFLFVDLFVEFGQDVHQFVQIIFLFLTGLVFADPQ